MKKTPELEPKDPRDMSAAELDAHIDALVAEKTNRAPVGAFVPETAEHVDITRVPKGYTIDGAGPDAEPGEFVRVFWSGTYNRAARDRHGVMRRTLQGTGGMHGMILTRQDGHRFTVDFLPGVSFVPVEIFNLLDFGSDRQGSLGAMLADGQILIAREGEKLRVPVLQEPALSVICNCRIARELTPEGNELHAKLYPIGHTVRTSALKKADFIRKEAARADAR